MITAFRKILQLLGKNEKKKLYLLLLAMFIGACIELVGVGSILPFLGVAADTAIVREDERFNFFYQLLGLDNEIQFVVVLGLAVIGFLIIGNATKAFIQFLVVKYTRSRRHEISKKLFSNYLDQGYSFFLRNNSSELSKNILDEVNLTINGVMLPLLQFFSKVFVTIVIVLFLVVMNPALALSITLVLGLIYGLVFGLIKKKLQMLGKERVEWNRKRYKVVSEALGGIKDVKLYGIEKNYLKDFDKASLALVKGDAWSELVGVIPKYFLESFAFSLIMGIVLFVLVSQGSLGELIPILGLYAYSGYRLMPYLQQLFVDMAKIKYGLPIVDSLINNMEIDKDQQDSKAKMEEVAGKSVEVDSWLQLDKIGFSYSKGTKRVLKEISLSIEENTSIGLVGSTGSGKTTLVDIILGLLVHDSGEIVWKGERVTGENRKNWQQNLGYVPQQIYLLDDSLKKNIAFGEPENLIDLKRVEEAARLANLHAFITKDLPDGYETLVGERGVRLSGGQRQRVGIARALYRNPAILILDEATSALDGITEDVIMEAIHSIGHKKTIIMVAHRLTTVKDCDKIYLLEEGLVIDQGTYGELYERNPRFRKMSGNLK